MTQYLYLVGFAPLLPMLPLVVALWLRERWNYREIKRLQRRHPLTQGLLRPPGYTLGQEVARLQIDGAYLLFEVVIFGVGILVIGLVALATLGLSFGVSLVVSLIALGAYSLYQTVRWLRLLGELRRKRLGWEGELATGEELNHLMRRGYAVFHDLEGEKFNIDHVAVGPGGVYAIETKARMKQRREGVEDMWRATYNGERIDFAGYSTDAPIEQARRNAAWLSKWLTSAVGERVTTKAVVALPGWYVTRTGRSDVNVVSAREVDGMVPKTLSAPLTEKLIQQIAHQLDARCRDVAKNRTPLR
ncbi:nuclease-related domain-containing protein [Salinisphaera orenii]|uniref:nuclease-related domain-containing protein n=1 Tax=Salinisphaera orenii TaxID=856731 RepID=UPI000F4C0CB4|nr:nuclease-related domain-containing protein [Salinisphaera orenii]